MLRSLYTEAIADTPEEAGEYGEMIVNSTIKTKFYKDVECHLFKDVYIEDNKGVHQIDHIFILKTGIFVVETKMFSNGKVIGDADDKIWVALNGEHKTQFVNPIIQNETHVRVVKDLLDDEYDVNSVVVFAWGNKPRNCKSPIVLNYSEFLQYPLNFKPKKELNSEDIKRICDILNENEKKKPELKAKHKMLIKARRQQ